MPLGDTTAILGKEWLTEHDPDISWRTMEIRFREEQGRAAGEAPDNTLIPPEYEDFADVFDAEKFKELPPHRDYDCAINFKEGATLPKPARPYPMSPDQTKQLREFLEQELQDGKIRCSKSEIAAPCFYIKKQDGSLRLVTDYRKINDITISDQFPIPLPEDLIEQLREAKVFTKLDLRWGYNNVRIKEGDEWKTAFRTKDGLFEYVVMPFGLKNAPGVFQRFMNELLAEFRGIFVIVYLDDILIFSKDNERHTEHVRAVLKKLWENHLFVRPKKCRFRVTTVDYVGLIIDPTGISMEKGKVKDVLEWPKPKTIKQIQAFLGFCNFYRRFIPDFSKIARPLHDLTQRGRPWKWEDNEQQD